MPGEHGTEWAGVLELEPLFSLDFNLNFFGRPFSGQETVLVFFANPFRNEFGVGLGEAK